MVLPVNATVVNIIISIASKYCPLSSKLFFFLNSLIYVYMYGSISLFISLSVVDYTLQGNKLSLNVVKTQAMIIGSSQKSN